MRYNWLIMLAVLVSPSFGDIPPHRAVHLNGVHGYADAWSVAAGGTIKFQISGSKPYQLGIYRLGEDVNSPAKDQLIYSFDPAGPNPQPIHPGSYVHVDRNLAPSEVARGFSLECWVRPWSTNTYQGLVTQYDFGRSSGVGLSLSPNGQVDFFLGGSSETRASAVQTRQWQHIVATWDGETKTLWVNGQEIGRWPYAGPVATSNAPLRLGAAGRNGLADLFLDGDLALPAVYNRALTPQEIAARFSDQGLHPPAGRHVLASWPLAEERGDVVADVSPFNRTGRIINHGTWGIGGPSFNAAIPRFSLYDPASDDRRGHALRLASDDLYDCRWQTAHEWRVPSDARPGIYVARFTYDYNGPCLYHVTFVVTRNPAAPKKDMLVLTSTNTWRAYNTNPFPRPMPGMVKYAITEQISQTGAPAHSLYRRHAAGQGSYQVGLRMPWPSAGPYVTYGEDPEYSHLCRAERPLHIWLEQNGYEYDLATELQLDKEPDLLDGYKVVVINGHSEYWSTPMYRAVEQYLAQEGKLAVLSGNTMFWRVSFNDDASIMECRKVDAPGAQLDPELRGERWHSQDGLIGGLMREAGLGEERLTGVITLGWNNVRLGQAGPFQALDVDGSPLFASPKAVALQTGDDFGDGANGHEFDALPSRLVSIQLEPTPPGAPSVPADPPGITLLARGTTRYSELGGTGLDWYGRTVPLQDNFGGDIIWWERPEGGRVFTIGAIGASATLAKDERLQQLFVNALSRFGVTPGVAAAPTLLSDKAARCDFNRDNRLDFEDFFAFASGFGKRRGEEGFEPKFDLDGNGQVEFGDFFIFARAFTERNAAKPAALLALLQAQQFSLEQNYPNPFNSATAVRYRLPSEVEVQLRIWSLTGQLVRTLVEERQAAGAHTAVWDARDDQGRMVASGAYICQLVAGPFQAARQVSLLK